MLVRTATMADISEAEKLYNIARKYMRKHGNMTQWAGEYPGAPDIEEHISKGEYYVGVNAEGHICLGFAFIMGEDPTYAYVEGGAWIDDSPYGTVHMLASDMIEHNGFEACVDFCRTLCSHIRMDTHKDNKIMLRKMGGYGFVRCGVIYVADGTPREAYELVGER